jgi:hypothetical protein
MEFGRGAVNVGYCGHLGLREEARKSGYDKPWPLLPLRPSGSRPACARRSPR